MDSFIPLLSAGLAFFVVAVSPGPATISNSALAMSEGRSASLIYGAGLSTGLVFWGLVAASGMGAVLQSSVYLLTLLKLAGGLYLLWLALLSARSAWKPNPAQVVRVDAKRRFMRGLVLNLSNPKSVIAWMAALSVGVRPEDGIASVIAATVVCIIVGFATNAAYSIVFSIDGVMKLYDRTRRKVDAMVAAMFVMAGFGLIRSAYQRGL